MHVIMSTSQIWLGSIFEKKLTHQKKELSIYFGRSCLSPCKFSLERLMEAQGDVSEEHAYTLAADEFTWRDLNILRLRVKDCLSDPCSREIGTVFTNHVGKIYLTLEGKKIWISESGLKYIANESFPPISLVELKSTLDAVGVFFNGIPPFEGRYSMHFWAVNNNGVSQEQGEHSVFLAEISSKKNPEISTYWMFDPTRRTYQMVHRDLKTPSSTAWHLPGNAALLYKALDRRLSVLLDAHA